MKRDIKFLSWSNLAIVIVFYVIISQTFSLKFYQNPRRIIDSDVSNYYAYLPLTFIFDQMDYHFDETSFPIVKDYLYSIPVGNGNSINPYTMGLAIAYSPFFFAVHLPMKWMNYPTTGFSQPYRISIILACLFYVLTALFLLKRILRKIFDDRITGISIIAVVLATNLLYYLTFEPGMPHAFNFAFGIYFLYLTIRWHENPGVLNSIGIGLLSGMISLIRPTDLIIALVFILWKVTSFGAIKNNILLFLRKWYLILIILFFAFLVWVPQMMYWNYFTGQYLYNPYKDLGFKFFFDNPQIYISLFSYRKGWLLYTPVMLLLIPGFVVLYRKYREYFWPVFIYFFINLWIISSWSLPWYGGSYGHRAYVASYSIMVIPLAAAFSAIFPGRKILGFITVIFITGLFVWHNLFQLVQYHNGAIHYVSMTKEAYWDSFMHKHPSPRLKFLLAFPDYESAKTGKYPTPVIDQRYTGKLTKDEILIKIQQEITLELESDSVKNIEWIDKAKNEGISYESLIKQQAANRMEEQINKGIIIPKQ
jgi:hypothetical protein